VSYPNAADRQRAARAGVNPGGDIMIHGLPARLGWIGRLHRTLDWTDGCVALTNAEVDELWRAVADGTPIDIRP
jgi:murein L,D-transpeptidase YafK